MKLNLSLTVLAGCCGLLGLIALFLPQELVALAGGPGAGTPAAVWLAQLLAAPVLALAMANWTARFSTVGGIYGRALVIANFTHGFIGMLICLTALPELGFAALPLGVAGVYLAITAVSGRLMFGRARLAAE